MGPGAAKPRKSELCIAANGANAPSEKLPGAAVTAAHKNISLLGAYVLRRIASGLGNAPLGSTKAAEASLREQDAGPRSIHTSAQEDRSTPGAVVLMKPPRLSRLFGLGLLLQKT